MPSAGDPDGAGAGISISSSPLASSELSGSFLRRWFNRAFTAIRFNHTPKARFDFSFQIPPG
jgi:hypothetical protein